MSDDVRADARRLREAIGDVAWRAVGSGVRNGDHWYFVENGEAIAYIAANDGSDEHLRQPRGEFIAAAPAITQRLLNEIERPGAEVGRLRQGEHTTFHAALDAHQGARAARRPRSHVSGGLRARIIRHSKGITLWRRLAS